MIADFFKSSNWNYYQQGLTIFDKIFLFVNKFQLKTLRPIYMNDFLAMVLSASEKCTFLKFPWYFTNINKTNMFNITSA